MSPERPKDSGASAGHTGVPAVSEADGAHPQDTWAPAIQMRVPWCDHGRGSGGAGREQQDLWRGAWRLAPHRPPGDQVPLTPVGPGKARAGDAGLQGSPGWPRCVHTQWFWKDPGLPTQPSQEQLTQQGCGWCQPDTRPGTPGGLRVDVPRAAGWELGACRPPGVRVGMCAEPSAGGNRVGRAGWQHQAHRGPGASSGHGAHGAAGTSKAQLPVGAESGGGKVKQQARPPVHGTCVPQDRTAR